MFSVMTLNIRFGLADDGDNSWRFRKDCFPKLFQQYRPDILGLQEVNDFQLDFLKDVLSEYEHIGRRWPAPAYWQNNIIFYKKSWRLAEAAHFFLSPTPEVYSRFEGSRWPRQCTMGVLQAGGRKLICVNSHFDFDSKVQTQSAELIMKRLSQLPAGIPTVLFGDFNAAPSDPCYQVFAGIQPNREVPGSGFKNVFHKPYPGTHHGFTGSSGGDHIDWILYRGKIVPFGGCVIPNRFEGRYPSDHFPLWVWFKWRNSVQQER